MEGTRAMCEIKEGVYKMGGGDTGNKVVQGWLGCVTENVGGRK